MRILTIHADFIEVEALKKAIADAEEMKEKGKKRYEEVLVVFTAVEAGDEDVAGSAHALADEAAAVADQVKTKRILLYPLVHLTSKPSAPRVAKAVVSKAEEELKERGYEASHSPFGWYKGYTLKCKGHPLSELSREFGAKPVAEKEEKKEEVSESLKKEAALKSRFYIMDLNGELHDIGKFNFGKYENLKKFAMYETKKVRAYEKEPPHIKIMKEHSLIDFEPGSDPGNFRHLPKGKLIKKLLEERITDICVNQCGALEVETPIMYDFEHPTLKKYLDRFPARQYTVLSDEKRLFLRFSACFGQFLIAHDMVISYKQLPMKMYELTRYSFRREQSGELAGLKRLRAFTMPDMHTFTADAGQAKAEFEKQFDIGLEWITDLGLDAEVGFRIEDDFFKENKDWYVRMARKFGRPILVEMFKERYAYFITKFEFNFVDSMDKASALTTVQIDVENADTYDINYVDKDGQKKKPLILHASLSGSIERVIYALLENEAMRMAKGQKAMFPVWLSPTQIRIIPVSEGQLEPARKIMERIDAGCVRVDLDDRNETLGKKIRDAQKDWIPYIAVIGDKEVKSGKLSVTLRKTDEKREMITEELVKMIERETAGKPFAKLSLPKLLSLRPVI